MIGLTRTGALVRLEIPAQPAFVGVARSVVAAVASALDAIDDDRLEDLRVAVSEACTSAVEAHRRAAVEESIVLACAATDTHLEVTIEDRAGGDGPALPATGAPEQGWGVQLIQALVDGVAYRRTEGGTAVDLVIRFGESGDGA